MVSCAAAPTKNIFRFKAYAAMVSSASTGAVRMLPDPGRTVRRGLQSLISEWKRPSFAFDKEMTANNAAPCSKKYDARAGLDRVNLGFLDSPMNILAGIKAVRESEFCSLVGTNAGVI
jgi:hypothetical protein